MKEVSGLSNRWIIGLVGVLTGSVTVFMPYCGCMLGLPGIIGGWFGLRKGARTGRQLEYGESAWLGFYGAVIGSIVALIICLVATDIFDLEKLRISLAEYGESQKEALLEKGVDQKSIDAEMDGLNISTDLAMIVVPWVPLFVLILNAIGGVGGGLLASLQARKRRASKG